MEMFGSNMVIVWSEREIARTPHHASLEIIQTLLGSMT